MLKYITEMPPEDCSKDRGYTLPFHSDMIFQFQNKKINDKFFAHDSESPVQIEVDKKKFQSCDMVEVLMTPTSESSDNLIYDEADDEEEQVTNEKLEDNASNGDTGTKKTNSLFLNENKN